MKWIFTAAIFFGSTSFLLDAFFAHGLKKYLAENYTDAIHHALTTAARYQLFAALFLILLVLCFKQWPQPFIIVSQIFTLMGVCFFCGAIYLKHLAGFSSLSFLAPLGGIALVIAFLSLLPVLFWL